MLRFLVTAHYSIGLSLLRFRLGSCHADLRVAYFWLSTSVNIYKPLVSSVLLTELDEYAKCLLETGRKLAARTQSYIDAGASDSSRVVKVVPPNL
jgi:hypothetical protein